MKVDEVCHLETIPPPTSTHSPPPSPPPPPTFRLSIVGVAFCLIIQMGEAAQGLLPIPRC